MNPNQNLPYHLVISFARNKLNPDQEERQVKEVDDMMEVEGSTGRTTKVKKKQLKVIYSFDTKEQFKNARNTFTSIRPSLDTGVFIDKQESAKLKEKRQNQLNQDIYGNAKPGQQSQEFRPQQMFNAMNS